MSIPKHLRFLGTGLIFLMIMLSSSSTRASGSKVTGYLAVPGQAYQLQNGVAGEGVEITADNFDIPLSEHEAVDL
jgi:hypothetical protein